MRRFEWTADYSICLREVDADHRTLFEIADKLDRAIIGGAPAEALQHLVSELAAEAAGHFAHEEKLMRETAYSAAAWHKAQHAHAMAQLQALQPGILRGETEAALALLAFLSDWLRNHIPLSDRMLAAHLRNRQRALAALAS